MKKEKAIVILNEEDNLKYKKIKDIKKRFYRGLIFLILGCIFLGISIFDAAKNKETDKKEDKNKTEEKTTIKK